MSHNRVFVKGYSKKSTIVSASHSVIDLTKNEHPKKCIHKLINNLLKRKTLNLLDLILTQKRDFLSCSCTTHLELISYAVYRTCSTNDIETFKYLLQKYPTKPLLFLDSSSDPYINLNFTTDEGENLLTTALLGNNYDMVNILLQKGVSTTYEDPNSCYTLYAVSKNNIEMLKLLISHNATCNPKCDIEYTPLYRSILNGKGVNFEITKLLLENGASTIPNNSYKLFDLLVVGHKVNLFELVLKYTVIDENLIKHINKYMHDNRISGCSADKINKILILVTSNYHKNLQLVSNARFFDENSLVYNDYLIEDLFKVILQNALLEHCYQKYDF